MRLKALQVQGYKSFANKVEFAFDEGITAVVGPNGSGKSNVADAIRWVLGEQSYSTLRGKKTEDMIFSGSASRARLGMAAATLILDNTDKWLPLDFSEVTVSRRAYRSGENEYYLNGSRVRLRDVNEILAKSGLSRQAYTVIGQGTIDRILSLHVEERRQLFEEAAGITFHRQKRAETLAKLDTTRGNLIRLNDIVKELEPRRNRLAKQAERAEEYRQLRADLEGLLRIWYGYRWRQGQLQLREAKARLRKSEQAVETQRKELRQLEAKIGHLRAEQTEVRGKLGAWYADNKQLYTEAETIQRELAVSEERGRQYAVQREELLAELKPLEESLEGQKRQLLTAQERLQAINREVAQANEAVQVAQRRVDAYQAQRQKTMSRQSRAEQRIRELDVALTERRARLHQYAERRETLLVERETAEAEIAKLVNQQAEADIRQAQLNGKLADIAKTLTALDVEQMQQQDRLAELNQAAEALKTQLSGLERKEDALKARQDLLGKLRNEMAGYYEGVRAVLQSEADLSGIVGTVSQIIRVPSELDVAIEMALGSRLQDVVTESFAEAEAAIAYLKKSRRGRATFLPLDTVRHGRGISVPDTPGVVGLATDLVEAEPRLRPIVEHTLNRTLVVEDLPAARRAFEAMQGGFQIVTLDGELMRSGGAVTGGRSRHKKGEEGTLLAREREWQELPDQLADLNQEQQRLSAQLADRHDEMAALKEERQALVDRQQAQVAEQQEVEAVANKVNRLLEQLASNLGWQQELRTKAEAELDRLEQRRADTENEINGLEQEKEHVAETARQLAEEVGQMSAEKLQAELNQTRTTLATIQEQQKSQQAILQNHQATEQQLTTQIETKRARTQSLAAEGQALLTRQEELRTRRQNFDSQLSQLTEQINQAEQRLSALEAQQLELEQADHTLRQRLQWLEAEHNQASLDAARRQDELDNLERQIQDDLGLVNLEMSDDQVGQPVLPIHPLVSDLPVVEELPAGVEEDVKRLKVQIRRLGNINPEAPREYAELRERYEFLSGQIADLEEAIADLKEVVARLDETMQQAFAETFEQVAKEFQRYFKSLFGGGEAQLILTEPDNLIDSGVDIVARPPGKRLQSMALLSGGERSLTAQALIFALLKTSPTPFVIFDEVDAMLDEANVGRFRDALVALAQEIQFIIITHNRKTIEAADTIYGISMTSDSVSQAYSLKLEEWLEEDGHRA
jgi:chromosome segregation protein